MNLLFINSVVHELSGRHLFEARNIVLSIVHGLRLRTVFLYFVDFPAVSKQLFYTCGTQADLHVELDGVHAEDLVADV